MGIGTLTWGLRVVLVLPTKERPDVFNPAEHQDDGRTDDADGKHYFQNPRQHGGDLQTHKHPMLFEMRRLDQFGRTEATR